MIHRNNIHKYIGKRGLVFDYRKVDHCLILAQIDNRIGALFVNMKVVASFHNRIGFVFDFEQKFPINSVEVCDILASGGLVFGGQFGEFQLAKRNVGELFRNCSVDAW